MGKTIEAGRTYPTASGLTAGPMLDWRRNGHFHVANGTPKLGGILWNADGSTALESDMAHRLLLDAEPAKPKREPFVERSGGKLRVGSIIMTASRWHWQAGYNWHGMASSSAPLNQPRRGDKAAPRFGGGWKYKLGLAYSGRTLMVDLLFGIVTFYRETAAERERKRQAIAERDARNAQHERDVAAGILPF